MTVIEAVKERHVPRAFLNKPVETEKLEQIMKAGRIALPSVKNKTEKNKFIFDIEVE